MRTNAFFFAKKEQTLRTVLTLNSDEEKSCSDVLKPYRQKAKFDIRMWFRMYYKIPRNDQRFQNLTELDALEDYTEVMAYNFVQKHSGGGDDELERIAKDPQYGEQQAEEFFTSLREAQEKARAKYGNTKANA